MVAALLAVAVCGGAAWHYYSESRRVVAAAAGAGAARAAIPVSTGKTELADFPVYLSGLGTVEPYQTVTVSSRVDGTVVRIGFKQGQMVAKGDILAEIDPRPYAAALGEALAKRAQDQASVKNAQLDLQRYTDLVRVSVASRQQVDTQQAKVDQLLAQISGDGAVINNAQTQLSYTTILAPIAGKTGFRLVDAGNIVHAAGTTGIVTIAKLQPISVVFTAPEQSIPAINKAFAAGNVPVTALTSDGLAILGQGRLAVVNNEVAGISGTISMKASFANTDNALWPGLAVSTRLLVDTLKQAVVMPDGAIQHGPDGLYAYVVGAGNKVAMKPITVGPEGGGNAVVLSGLSPGETVVTAGQYRLVAGSVVQPGAASAPPAKAP